MLSETYHMLLAVFVEDIFICQMMAVLHMPKSIWEIYSFLYSLQLTEDFLDIVDNILDIDQDILQESQEMANTSAMWESNLKIKINVFDCCKFYLTSQS